MIIGSRIKAIRGALSQKDFALKIGAGQKSIHSWEAGHAAPGARSLEAIHRVFGVDIHWLLTGEGEPYINNDRKEIAPPGMIREPPAEYEERVPGLGQAVDMVATVLGSGNDVFIRSLMSSLLASSEGVKVISQQNQRLSALLSELDDVRKRLAALEEKIKKEEGIEKEENVKEKPA